MLNFNFKPKIIKITFKKSNLFMYALLFKIAKIRLNLHIFFLKDCLKSLFYFSNFLFLLNFELRLISSKVSFKYYFKVFNGKLFLKFYKKSSKFDKFLNCFNFIKLFKQITQ